MLSLSWIILLAGSIAMLLGALWAKMDQRSSNNQSKKDSRLRMNDYPEALATYRHYSNLRFVMLTLFTTISGFMLGALLSDKTPSSNNQIINYLPTVGAWLTIVFLSLELILDTVQSNIANFINSATPDSHMKKNRFIGTIQAAVRVPILIFFFVLFWLWSEISGKATYVELLFNN